jgi:hypothetical protein
VIACQSLVRPSRGVGWSRANDGAGSFAISRLKDIAARDGIPQEAEAQLGAPCYGANLKGLRLVCFPKTPEHDFARYHTV